MKLAVADGIRQASLGILIGVVMTSIAARAVTTLLYDVGSNDPVVFTATIAVLAAASVIAAYIPARKATAADPISRLRPD